MSALQANQLKSLLDKGKSIATHILEGSIKIESLAAFEPLFKQFPKDPALHRAYADSLLEKKKGDDAAQAYDVAFKLYFESGFVLQAIVAKLLQWRIQPPASAEMKRFLEEVRRSKQPGVPITAFVNKLTVREMNVVFSAMELIRLQPEHVVGKVGDPEQNLFFVVCGTLVDSAYWSLDQREKRHRNGIFYLSEDDFWGEIYPFEEDHQCQSHIETLTRCELLKLGKAKLIKICKKYPNVETGLLDLFQIRAESRPDGFSPLVRRASRHQLPIKVNVEIAPNGSIARPLVFKGYSRDISVGGISVVLEAEKLNVSYGLAAFHNAIRDASVQVALVDEALALQVSGKVVWSREVVFEGQKTLALGVQFTDMSPKLRGVLFAFADGLGRQKHPASS